ncbi:MAG: hypothetical protein H0V97_07020 [Actinobacteria bacterium]|nr:hypothetical protein [Actinomycetota bacterium]
MGGGRTGRAKRAYEGESLGAVWEGDDLVTYNLGHLIHRFGHDVDGYMEDVD